MTKTLRSMLNSSEITLMILGAAPKPGGDFALCFGTMRIHGPGRASRTSMQGRSSSRRSDSGFSMGACHCARSISGS